MEKLQNHHLKVLASLVLGLVLFATFFPLGYQRRISSLSGDVSRLSADVSSLRDALSRASSDYKAAMDRVATLVCLSSPSPGAMPVVAPGDGEEQAERFSRRATVPGVYTAACGRVGVRVGTINWWVGDRTPFGRLSAAGPGWCEFDGCFVSALGGVSDVRSPD